jgi:hypothetical protein
MTWPGHPLPQPYPTVDRRDRTLWPWLALTALALTTPDRCCPPGRMGEPVAVAPGPRMGHKPGTLPGNSGRSRALNPVEPAVTSLLADLLGETAVAAEHEASPGFGLASNAREHPRNA